MEIQNQSDDRSVGVLVDGKLIGYFNPVRSTNADVDTLTKACKHKDTQYVPKADIPALEDPLAAFK